MKMKSFKFILIFFVALFSTSLLFGQTERGSFLIGGGSNLSGSFYSAKAQDDDRSEKLGKGVNFNFAPSIGIFVVKGLAVGVEIPIQSSTYENTNDNMDDYKSSSFSASFSPFVRYYFGSKTLKPYAQSNVGYGVSHDKIDFNSGTDEETNVTSTFSIGGGIAYFINEKVSFDLGLGYVVNTTIPTEDNENNFRYVTSGLGVRIGVIIIL